MKNAQKQYIKQYQKNNYKMYQFRVRKDNIQLINKLEEIDNRNNYIVSLISNDCDIRKNVYTIAKIKSIIKPILAKYGINEVYLFGSYARGEANEDSDIDIYCEDGNLKTLFDQIKMENSIREALNKDVDIVYMNSNITPTFKKSIEKDLIKLC